MGTSTGKFSRNTKKKEFKYIWNVKMEGGMEDILKFNKIKSKSDRLTAMDNSMENIVVIIKTETYVEKKTMSMEYIMEFIAFYGRMGN